MSLLLGPSMLDDKLFVSRTDDPFPDLYERFWDGFEWIWVNHGRPGGVRMKGAPGAAMVNEKLFVVVDDGALWQRHWRADLSNWAWENHGRPENRPITFGPDAAMMDSKLFVVVDDGALWELNWRSDLGRWAWENHGRPENKRIVAAPGAAMLNEKLFVTVEDGELWERHWRQDMGGWAWQNHGRPEGKRIVTAPGAAMSNSKLFVAVDDGALWELNWRGDLGRWAWGDHGRPGNQAVVAAPGAAMMDSRFFVVAGDGSMWERNWRGDLGRWAWQDHGHPPESGVVGPPGAALMNSKLFVSGANNHLFERAWTGTEWKWVDHGTAYHDQSAHVIGTPGRNPKMTIAVLGDGFAEADMEEYRALVRDAVVSAFHLDQMGDNIGAFRVVRVDVASPVTGVSERDYDEHGTTDSSADDTLTSEVFRFSRLGTISTGIWSHCWIELSGDTMARISHIVRRFVPDANHTIVMVNSGRFGGCSHNEAAFFTKGSQDIVIAHESGHNFFFLGDEYHQGNQNFAGIASPANLSETPVSWDRLKWSALVTAGAALPTDAGHLPSGWDNNRSVGAFEGGHGSFATGIFHPAIDCRMNSNNPPWCPVCGGEINRILGAFP